MIFLVKTHHVDQIPKMVPTISQCPMYLHWNVELGRWHSGFTYSWHIIAQSLQQAHPCVVDLSSGNQPWAAGGYPSKSGLA